MSRYNLYLNLIDEMINKILVDSGKSLDDDLVWDAMLMRIQVIGENINKLPKDVLEKHKEINWEKFYLFRNVVSHSYVDILSNSVSRLIDEMPVLKKTIKKIRSELK